MTSASRRSSPRFTARSMTPDASSQLTRRCFATALTLACFSQSMASTSNNAVNCEPGSAHGTCSCLIP